MLKPEEIRRQVGQRLRELLGRAVKGWEEIPRPRIRSQVGDLLVKFRLGDQERTLVVKSALSVSRVRSGRP